MRSFSLSAFCFVLGLSIPQYSYAQVGTVLSGAYTGTMNNALAAIVETNIVASGEAAAGSALMQGTFAGLATSVTGYATGVEVVGATLGAPVSWAAVLIAAAATAGASGVYCFYHGGFCENILNNGLANLGIVPPTYSNINVGGPLYYASGGTVTVYGSSPEAVAGEVVSNYNSCVYNPSNCNVYSYSQTGGVSAVPGSNGYTVPWSVTPKSGANAGKTVPNGFISISKSQNTSSINCQGATSQSSTSCTNAATPPQTTYVTNNNYLTVNNNIPSTYINYPVDPASLVAPVNQIWQAAAALPGYAGVPYNPLNPVTETQVAAALATLPQPLTAPDLAASVASPGTVAAVAPNPAMNGTVQIPASASINPASPTQSNGGPVSVQNLTINTCGSPGQAPCEIDWGGGGGEIPPPTPPNPPSFTDSIGSFFSNRLSGLTNWQAPSHSSGCPTVSFVALGHNYVIDAQCVILEQNNRYLFLKFQSFCHFAMLIFTFKIVLSA